MAKCYFFLLLLWLSLSTSMKIWFQEKTWITHWRVMQYSLLKWKLKQMDINFIPGDSGIKQKNKKTWQYCSFISAHYTEWNWQQPKFQHLRLLHHTHCMLLCDGQTTKTQGVGAPRKMILSAPFSLSATKLFTGIMKGKSHFIQVHIDWHLATVLKCKKNGDQSGYFTLHPEQKKSCGEEIYIQYIITSLFCISAFTLISFNVQVSQSFNKAWFIITLTNSPWD